LHHARITKFTGAEFVFEHDGGIAHVPWSKMPASYQEQYPFDQDRAEQEKAEAAQNKATVAAEQHRQLRQRFNVRLVSDVASNIPAFDKQEVSFEGELEPSNYYGSQFSGHQAELASFRLTDGDAPASTMWFYFRRPDCGALVNELSAAKNHRLRAIVTVYVNAQVAHAQLLAEGIGFQPLPLQNSIHAQRSGHHTDWIWVLRPVIDGPTEVCEQFRPTAQNATATPKPNVSVLGTVMEPPRYNLDTEVKDLQIGMSAEKVLRILGNPLRVNGEQWVYARGYIYIRNGKLEAMQNFSGDVFDAAWKR
jgi:hypothetical protein